MSDRDDDHLIPKHGGYRKLRSFHAALAVYDANLIFCERFVDNRTRTHDQMVQAARSGVQNIAEGSLDSGTSKKTELKLTGVARGSLVELLRDYEDFLRSKGLPIWDKNSPEALAVRAKYRSENPRYQSDQSDQSDGSDRSDQSDWTKLSDPKRFHYLKTPTPEVAANTLLCLINQATYLIRKQLERLDRDFLEQGGFTERLYKMRTERRESASSGPLPPTCPTCGQPMRLRTARRGPHTGQQFWGCSTYPDCKGTRPADP
jgi:four helix bundle suffix protein